jgi:predicted kinase
MGLPGSGKTTLASILASITGATLVSSDESRLLMFEKPSFSPEEHDMLYTNLDHNVEHLLEAGKDVIYDANLNRLEHRQQKYILAHKHGADVRLWWVQVPEAYAKNRRMSEQDERLIPSGETSEKMFDRIASIIEQPLDTELYSIVDGTDIKPETISKLL